MITFEEAFHIISSQPPAGGTERIGFMQSSSRVLAEDICSDMDMPPFDKSAMDGYACREEDLPGPLRILEEIPAGKMPQHRVERGTCSRIMTGAPLPEGADCVLMEEHISLTETGDVLFTKASTKPNICYTGEDIKKGDLLIAKGTLIRPEHIAILASTGATEIWVSVTPSIGIYTTGNELVEPWVKPSGSQIRNSNGYQILAQLSQNGFNATYTGIIHDTPEATEAAVTSGFQNHDILILTGGVSQGTHDFVPQVMERCGVEILFHQLAVQPGKPSLFGKRAGGKYLFGLPGNPVSSFIQTELLVKQLCYGLQGYNREIPLIPLPLGTAYNRQRSARKSFVPVRICHGKVFPVEYHGSAHIQALHGAHGVIGIESGVEQIKEGEPVHVRLF